MQVFIIAGEASGDLHGSNLIRALKARLPQARFVGIGGPHMQDAGLELLFPISDLAVVGVVEVISHIRSILKAFNIITDWLRNERPDLLIVIDYPDFNLRVASKAKRLSIPILYYISPQVWAWRQGRVKKLRRLVDRMAVILPFEKEFFRSHGMEVDFVGHPLLDVVKAHISRNEFCKKIGLDPERPLIGLVPGSRRGEVSRLFPLMLKAAGRIYKNRQDIQFVVPLAPSLDPQILKLDQRSSNCPVIKVVRGQTYDAIAASNLIIAASGTVTLEAGILATPMIVTYRLSPITYFLGRHLIKVPFASLVNLVSGYRLVPELLQWDATPARLSAEALSLLEDPVKRETMVKGLHKIRDVLGGHGAAEKAADIAVEIIGELEV